MQPLKDTEFHRSMREKMRKHYHEKDGRKKKMVRYYLKKHNLERKFLHDCDTIDDEITKLKRFNWEQRFMNEFLPLVFVTKT